MIIRTDFPQKSLFYWGAFVIDEFIRRKEEELDLLELYSSVKGRVDISMDSLILTLDWLFIMGMVEYKNRMIKRCFYL